MLGIRHMAWELRKNNRRSHIDKGQKDRHHRYGTLSFIVSQREEKTRRFSWYLWWPESMCFGSIWIIIANMVLQGEPFLMNCYPGRPERYAEDQILVCDWGLYLLTTLRL